MDSFATWSQTPFSQTLNQRFLGAVLISECVEACFEFRLPDGAANPYLLPASVLAAGLHGMQNKVDPGKRMDTNMYQAAQGSAKKLPQTLADALSKLGQSKVLRAGMGDEFVDSYLKLKGLEWSRYLGQVSQWERDTYLDV